MRRLILFLLSAILLPVTAHAQCDNPHAAMGVIIFNKAHKIMQYCNGDDWIGIWGGRGGAGELGKLSDVDLSAPSVGQALIFDGTKWGNSSVLATPPTCTGSNNALQWDGGSWNCVNIEGGSTFDLVNGQHSSVQCTSVGGTVFISGSEKMCRINGATCPTGWARYQNWNTYTARSCNSGCTVSFFGGTPSCTASARAWSNIASASSCTYSLREDEQGICISTTTCVANLTQIACY